MLPALALSRWRRLRLSNRAFWAGLLIAIGSLSVAPNTAFAAENATEAGDDDDGDAENDNIISLAAYNAKADRIEDFGLRIWDKTFYTIPKGGFWPKFAPMISAVVPNTAAAKAGLQPGERILKSDGQSMVSGVFSFGKWRKTQDRKWKEVSSGKKNVTWTLEVENPATKALRTVKLVVPTPPPHWGTSIWQPPEGRPMGLVSEPGPLADRARAVLDNGIWVLLDWRYARVLGDRFASGLAPKGYEWRIGNRGEGMHRIFVTQFRDRTDIFLETSSRATGTQVYLTSPSGALERAWQWRRRGKSGEAPLDEARDGFEQELDFWTTKVGKFSERWPFAVKPGYDANALFAVAAAKDGTPLPPRTLAADFLKLPAANEAQQAMFADAYAKLGAEQDCWAYTETSRGLDDKRLTVTRVDPSQPPARQSVLVSLNGKPPTAEDVQRWRDDGGDTPKALGDLPPLANLIDLKDLRVFQEETAAIVFELPLRTGNPDFPAEKFQALFRVNQTFRSFEDITVKMRDSIRLKGVVKVTEAGLQARFQTLDPKYPPQPISLKGGGAARIILVKISRDFEATRTDFKRVEPYREPDPAEPATLPVSLPLPGTL